MNIPTLTAQFGTSFGLLQANLQGFTQDNASDALAHGVNVVTDVESVPWGRYFSIKDPYGNLIDVLQPAPR